LIPKECKRLAEVDFPIADVSRHAAREKSIRHGHPSTLHLWWARRPLASSRAVLLGLLWPDPSDPLCPDEFKRKARELLPRVQGVVGPTDEELRKAVLKFIGDFANWDLAANRTYLEVSRALVKAAHGEEPPLVVDPFAGGGSIPLEALRLGCEAFASDLNPVACLILKVMLEDIPRHGPELAKDLRRVGAEIKRRAEKELAELYPKDPDGATPIAYVWARTVRCESPNCGAEIPLVRSFWLCKSASRQRALRHRVEQQPEGQPPRVEFEVFEPRTDKEVPGGTVRRAKATCLCCGVVLAPERVRAQLTAQHGGADVVLDDESRRTDGARMLAVVTLRPGEGGRHYRLPTSRDYVCVRQAQQQLRLMLDQWERDGSQAPHPVPGEPLRRVPVTFGVINVWVYGMLRWGDLFTARQKAVLLKLIHYIRESDGPSDSLSLSLSKLASGFSSLAAWRAPTQDIGNMFERVGLSMLWDFAEAQPLAGATRGWDAAIKSSVDVIERIAPSLTTGRTIVQLADAQHHPLPDESCALWFTDPPYYDSVPYSHLSDLYFVWLKRALNGKDSAQFSGELTPKENEIVAYLEGKETARSAYDRFEGRLSKAFAEGRRVLREDGIGSVVFAHKTTEGWEALLSGMVRGGWTITGSWPIATEMASRLRARESAALATSVHLVCRPRPEDAAVGDWGDVLRALPKRVADWMERLQGEGIRGADLVFACVGPALEIFSRYARVETADGREVGLAEYLEKVWEVVGRSALAQILGTAEAKARNGAVGAVEEDARLTALFLWTLQSTSGDTPEDVSGEREDEDTADDGEDEEGLAGSKARGLTLVFDVVRRFAQPLGIELQKWEGRVIETKKGIVRLLPIAERAKQLFGEDGAQAVAARLEQAATARDPLQGLLFPETQPTVAPAIRGRGRGRGKRAGGEVADESLATAREATTLDRVHAAMLFQASGRTSALRGLLKAEQERGPDFLRLANALSALYPKGSEEKRLVDAMLLAVPR